METLREQSQRHIWLDGLKIKVPVTEEIYLAYMRPQWAEEKRRARESRCRTGKGSRCQGDCQYCEKKEPGKRTGRSLSLEQFSRDGFNVPDNHADPLEFLLERLPIEELRAALDELAPENLRIIELLFFEEMTEQQVADQIGLSQKGVNKRKSKILSQLRGCIINSRRGSQLN